LRRIPPLSHQLPFQVAQESFQAIDVSAFPIAVFPLGMVHEPMPIPLGGNARIPAPAIRAHCSALAHSGFNEGNVEKSRQRRSRPFAALTYYEYAPRVNRAAALLDGLF